MRMWVQSLASLRGLRSSVATSCGVGRRCGSDPVLLWLCRKLATTALIGPLAWEPPYATSEALKSKNKTKQNKTHTPKFSEYLDKNKANRLAKPGQM